MNKNEEIDLKKIFNLIINSKITFIKINSICLFLVFIYSLIKVPIYSSYFSVYPINQDTSNIGNSIKNLKGLASSFGIELGSQSSALFYIPDIIESRMLKKDLVENKWSMGQSKTSIDLIDFWKIKNESLISFSKIINTIFKNNEDREYLNFLDIAINKLEERIIVDELDSGLFKVYVLMEDPELAAEIANYIARYIDNYITNNINVQSTKYRIFLGNRLENAKILLNTFEDKLTQFRKTHPIALDTPDLQLKRMRLLRDVEINQEVYLTILTQYELAKINELKEKPVINILDNAYPAVDKYSPKLLYIIFFSIIFSCFLSVSIILFNNYSYLNRKES